MSESREVSGRHLEVLFYEWGGGFGGAILALLPLVKLSEGSRITWSETDTPWVISSLFPKSRLMVILRISTCPSDLTTPTAGPCRWKSKVFSGRARKGELPANLKATWT